MVMGQSRLGVGAVLICVDTRTSRRCPLCRREVVAFSGPEWVDEDDPWGCPDAASCGADYVIDGDWLPGFEWKLT